MQGGSSISESAHFFDINVEHIVVHFDIKVTHWHAFYPDTNLRNAPVFLLYYHPTVLGIILIHLLFNTMCTLPSL